MTSARGVFLKKINIANLCFFTGLIFLFLSSCATGEKFSSVNEGMTKEQVREAMGKEDQIDKRGANGDWVVYYYKNRLLSGWSWDKTDYYVVFDPNGKVYSYGHGDVDTRTSERMAQLGIKSHETSDLRCVTTGYGNTTTTNCSH